MTCPYLKEVSMVFCRAYPVAKPVPSGRITTASTCEGEFRECPLFQEAIARAARSVSASDDPTPAGPEGATS